MTSRTVASQAELDRAVADGVEEIEIRSPRGVEIEVSDSVAVYAYGPATVRASGSATVRAYDSATVRAYDSASVYAYGPATVRAYDSATVRAYDSATVRASGSATVRASGSATVRASGSTTVTAYGSSTVRAGSHVAVHLHSGRATVEGGVLIDHTSVDESDPATWASYHGATTSGDAVTLFKAVRDDYLSAHGTRYEIGAEVSCDDFEDTDACGSGLHFSPTPGQAADYDSEATRFLECTVLLAELRPITGPDMTAKCKSPRAQVLREVDIVGRPVQAAVSTGGAR